MIFWIAMYLLISLFYKWVISWGGAKTIEGWKSFFLIGWFALDWNSEQIRLYALIGWLVTTVIFIIGCFNSQFREEYFWY
ncbi:hypothetical protein [Moraxella lincolnii]|uniref:hypothetical protein n=1 Tax=Lwoffella lincolnii TaxID=90241 RepID=UPI0030D30CCF